MSATGQTTPMMQQYLEYRRSLPDGTLLLFRLGDFYEMFFGDAEEGARILGITLTKRQNTPMAGIPYHAAQTYIAKLLCAGKKVAVCDQMEAPQPGKLVKRALVRILTPGTTIEDHQLDARKNHYILALSHSKAGLHAAWLDLSTGEFAMASDANPERLLPAFAALDPREVLVPEDDSKLWGDRPALAAWYGTYRHFSASRPVSTLPDYHFDAASGYRTVVEALGVLNLDGFGISRENPGLGPAGALVYYASENLCDKPRNLRRLREYRTRDTLLLDPATLRNLEVFQSAQGTREGSLLAAVDGTVTPSGARLLEQWLASPLRDLAELRRRGQAVGEFLEEPGLSSRITESLRCVRDIPRILARLQNRVRNPRELGGVRDTLRQLPEIKAELARFRGDVVPNLAARVGDFLDLREYLDRALAEELPSKIEEGGVLREGFDAELDRLRSLTRDNKTWITEFERVEQERTGIRNLRIRFNGAFGYFIEVTKSNLSSVPAHYIRKQTMTNAERYTTEELKQREREILHAEEKALAREEDLFRALIARVLEDAESLRATADALAEIDLFIGWAKLAREWDYCRPTLDAGDVLDIDQGRHPVVEQMLRRDRMRHTGLSAFVPNNTMLSSNAEQIALITGPNMAGKSTYIRQVALIVLLAQVGCWVPAKRCHVGLVDRIFSRVGASDELARGNSTFMVEMNETANILNNATERSLIILDEIGRGTSTYDGLSIAWAVVEFLHGDNARGPRTLFATHYHELTQLDRTLSRLRNYSVSVKEWNDEIIFVRQVIPGAADRSYGIHVARLAGLPHGVIDRAKTVLEQLETEGAILQSRLKLGALPKPSKRPAQKEPETPDYNQLALF